MKRKKLSLHVNRKVATNTAGKPEVREGGLFEDQYAFPGTRVLNIYSRDGKRLGRWEAIAGVTDDEFEDALEALLARREPSFPKLVSVGGTGEGIAGNRTHGKGR